MPASQDLVIRELGKGEIPRWDRFVTESSYATFFHRAGWKEVIERSFGHPAYYFYAERAGAIEGILPLVHVKSLVFGNALVSLPFCVYAGAVARTDQALRSLDQAARDLADRLDVTHVEYRHIEAPSYVGAVTKADVYATFRKRIGPDPEENLNAIPRKQRAMIRKGQKFGLRSEIDGDVRRLHRVYSESVRNLGTPVFSVRYFAELKREFGDACEILVVMHGDQPVSAVMSFHFRDEVLPYYGGGTALARSLAANDFMYWEVMRRACAREARTFDFGRSKRGTGAFDFKKNWGFAAQSLNYQFIMRRGEKPPEINPLNPKFRIFIEAWKRLPLPIANRLGPHIVRYLG